MEETMRTEQIVTALHEGQPFVQRLRIGELAFLFVLEGIAEARRNDRF
ncbi:hypothetical protein L3D22_10980 [Lysobacter soli]|nr:hypothetical protein [Lysobacter soli]UTA52911.1 hypothetical protein L3D22_10980 [Lysobacter soli]